MEEKNNFIENNEAETGGADIEAEDTNETDTASCEEVSTDAKSADTEEKPKKEYHDVLWYAVQSIKDNALQTTYQPPADAPDGCTGGCATCGFKCAHSVMMNTGAKSEYDKPTTNDPYGERHRVDLSEAPAPETTFPMLQVLAALAACIIGCYLANKFFLSIFA